jgi:hypothetical protein
MTARDSEPSPLRGQPPMSLENKPVAQCSIRVTLPESWHSPRILPVDRSCALAD